MKKLTAMDLFSNSINSSATLAEYLNKLRRYEKFFKIDSWDDYIKQSPDEIHDELAFYINAQKKTGIKNHTVKGMMSPVYLMLEINRVPLFKKILQKMLPQDAEIEAGKVPYTTEEISDMLEATDRLRSKALIHYFASTGSRPASITDPILRMKHLDNIEDCIAVRIYDGYREGYWGFLTPEASSAMNAYHAARRRNGEVFDDETPVFSNTHDGNGTKGEAINTQTVREILYRIMKNAQIERKKIGKRFDKAAVYGFRKRFNTILKLENDLNSNIAEKLMAHKRGLDGTYLQPTLEECFAEFKKAIPRLTVDPTQRQRIELQKTIDEKNELKKKNIELMNEVNQRLVVLEALANATQDRQ